MIEKDFVCPLEKVESLEDFFSKESTQEGECRSCRLLPLTEFYLGVLEEHGEKERAQALAQVFEEGDVPSIAKAMDNIKKSVGEDVRKALSALDCLSQIDG